MEAVFILPTFAKTIRNCYDASEAYCLSTANSDLCPLADQIGHSLEPAPQPFPIKGRISRRKGQNEGAIFVAERRLVDDAGHTDREHMGGPDRGANDPGPALHALADEASQPVRELSSIIVGRLVAVEDR